MKKIINVIAIIFMVIMVVTANMASMGYITDPTAKGFWIGFNVAGIIAASIYYIFVDEESIFYWKSILKEED